MRRWRVLLAANDDFVEIWNLFRNQFARFKHGTLTF